ncbi:AlkZ-related protein [Paenibacillus sp. strain BS8-2]
MEITTYDQFVELVERYGIFPFAALVPEHPALTIVTEEGAWHTEQETDPWLWRIRIAGEGKAAYGKFFGSKAAFIQSGLFPAVKTLMTGGQTVDERYESGSLSRAAFRIYGVIREMGNVDSRSLRKEAGFGAQEDKKEYDKGLNELQSGGYIVITGSDKRDEGGWSSMCYETSETWLQAVLGDSESLSLEEAKRQVKEALEPACSEKAYAFFAKKLGLNG